MANSGMISSSKIRKETSMNEPKDAPETPAPKRKLSVFASAITSSSVSAEIDPADVCELRPDWTRAQAEGFLRENAETVGREMVAAGVQFVAALIERSRHAN